jgi:hypothetical protein
VTQELSSQFLLVAPRILSCVTWRTIPNGQPPLFRPQIGATASSNDLMYQIYFARPPVVFNLLVRLVSWFYRSLKTIKVFG